MPIAVISRERERELHVLKIKNIVNEKIRGKRFTLYMSKINCPQSEDSGKINVKVSQSGYRVILPSLSVMVKADLSLIFFPISEAIATPGSYWGKLSPETRIAVRLQTHVK